MSNATTSTVTKAGKLHGATKCQECALTAKQATAAYLPNWPTRVSPILVRQSPCNGRILCEECEYTS